MGLHQNIHFDTAPWHGVTEEFFSTPSPAPLLQWTRAQAMPQVRSAYTAVTYRKAASPLQATRGGEAALLCVTDW